MPAAVHAPRCTRRCVHLSDRGEVYCVAHGPLDELVPPPTPLPDPPGWEERRRRQRGPKDEPPPLTQLDRDILAGLVEADTGSNHAGIEARDRNIRTQLAQGAAVCELAGQYKISTRSIWRIAKGQHV